MTDRIARRAGLPGAYSALQTPIARETASQILGCEISEETWRHIEMAFELYGKRLDQLTASKVSRKKDDAQGWAARKAATVRALEDVLKKLEASRARHGNFLHEASENYSLQTYGVSAGSGRSAKRLLDEAFRATLAALVIIERAEPREIEIPTEARSRDMLVQDVFRALHDAGLDPRASYGATLDQLERVTLADLTPFEKLIAEFQLGDEKKPAAFAAFVRSAIAGGNRG